MMDGRASGTVPIMADAKLPPLHTGESDFLVIRGDKCLYVDKTPHLRGLLAVRSASAAGHIPSLEHKYQFLARPRRFGKSLLINTLEAWFQGVPPNHELADASEAAAWPEAPAGWSRPRWLWEGLDAEDWHGLHGWHPVIRLSLPLPTSLDAGEIRIGLTTHLRNLGLEWEDRGVPWLIGVGKAPIRIFVQRWCYPEGGPTHCSSAGGSGPARGCSQTRAQPWPRCRSRWAWLQPS